MMIRTQLTVDKFAMTLSLACAAHCFLVPSFVILTSGFLALSLDNELVHKLIVIMAVPASIFSLTVGYRHHKTISFLPMGILGLLILTAAAVLGADALGEFEEKGLTLLGSIFVAYSHFRNYQTCRNLDCSCHDE